MRKLSSLALLLVVLASPGCRQDADTVVIGGKKFSEQSILGEMYATLIEENTNLKVERRFWLGGTQVVHQAILRGDIDMYPEYTGTAYQVILKEHELKDPGEVYEAVKSAYAGKFHLEWLKPVGFNNTYALTMRREEARRLGVGTISQLAAKSSRLSAGMDPEFLERPDGWPGLQKTYDLQFGSRPRQLDPGIVYRAVASGDVDVVDTYSTDGRIPAFGLLVLRDDKRFFPPYYAAPVVRQDLIAEHPELRGVLNKLAGQINESEMQQLNHQVDQQQKRPEDVAKAFLKRKGLI